MRTPLRSRAALTLLSFVLVVGGLLELAVAWTLTGISLGLLILVIGAPLPVLATLLVRRFAAVERYLAGRILGERIPAYYRPRTGRWWQRLRTVLRDPATWRDLAWTFVAATYGTVLCVVVITLFCGVLWYAAFPLLWLVTPAGLFRADYGFVDFDSQPKSFIAWIFAAVFAVLWWWLTPRLMRVRAASARSLLRPTQGAQLRARVKVLATTRAESLDASAAELRRIERDLHDGVQARLVALSINLAMAEELLDRDPKAARGLLTEARAATGAGLVELRSVVRGMHPPVLADRGLVGAVQAAALASPFDVTVDALGVTRLPAPVESAVYFAVAELLTNVARHSNAEHVYVRLRQEHGRLSATVGDDGHGGARIGRGSGLTGVQKRLSAFDGTVVVESPTGGPTRVVLEVPCA